MTSTVVTPGRRERTQPRLGEREQFVFAARAKVAHRRVDAAAAPRDLHVGNARGAKLLLFVARAAEDRVRVRVDEAGREHAACAVDRRGARMLAAKRLLVAHLGDDVAVP